MQKVVIILIMLYLTACSVSKPVIRSNAAKKDIEGKNLGVTALLEQNISSNSFLIQKAEVEITDQGEKQRFFASIKFNKPDSFLISVRSTTGIEAVRIFATSDTVLINDRLNRTFLYGTQEAARKKYGLSSALFPLFLGDVILFHIDKATQYKCENGLIILSSVVKGTKVDYSINCENLKPTEISLTRETDIKPVFFRYSGFQKVAEFLFAGRVYIEDLNNIDLINVKFSKIDVPWDGHIDFVPGSNYEQVEIK